MMASKPRIEHQFDLFPSESLRPAIFAAYIEELESDQPDQVNTELEHTYTVRRFNPAALSEAVQLQ